MPYFIVIVSVSVTTTSLRRGSLIFGDWLGWLGSISTLRFDVTLARRACEAAVIVSWSEIISPSESSRICLVSPWLHVLSSLLETCHRPLLSK